MKEETGIAVISTSSSTKCGIGIYTENLYSALPKEKRDKIIILSNDFYQGNLKYERVWKKGLDFLSPFKILHRIFKKNCRVVHLQHEWLIFGSLPANLIYALMLFFVKLLGKKTLVTFHTVFDLNRLTEETLKTFNIKYPLKLVKIVIKFLTKFYAEASTVIIVHNEHMKKTLVKQYKVSSNKVVVIPHFVKKLPKMKRDDAKRRLDLQGKKVILLFGLIRKGKGYEYVIKAFQKVKEKIPNSILLIVGAVQVGKLYWGEQYLKELKQLVKKLELEGYVIFLTKYIPDEEVPIFFGAADVLVLPYEKGKSYYSVSGILHLAMNFGTPVIAAKTLQFSEVKDEENGKLVEPEDTKNLANTIIELLEDRRRRLRYSENLKKLAEERTVKKCAEKHWKLYQKLIKYEKIKYESKIAQILPHILVLLPILLMILNLDMINTGNDTLTHLYKAWILRQQIKTIPIWLWGRWDWTWYLGNPFLRSYSPLFYYVLATLSLVTPFWLTARILLSVITPLAYISTYKALKYFTKNKIVSIVFATVYIYSPAHIVPFYLWGSVGQALTTIIIPQYLIQLHKTVQTNQNRNVLTTALMLASIILLNMAVGFWMTILTSIWILLKNQLMNLLKIGLCSASLTTSFLYAYLTAEGTMLPVLTPLSQVEHLVEWLRNSYGISILQVELTIIAYTAVIFTYLKFRGREIEKVEKPHWEKSFETMAAVIMITLVFSTLQIYPFSIIGGDRVLTVSGFILVFIGAYYISKIKNFFVLKNFAVMLIAITLLTGILYQPYNPIHPETYNELYQTIKEDPEWFRVLFLPREPWGALTPLYTNHPTLNGWYPQCLPPEVFNTLGSLITYDKYAYLERNLTAKPKETINLIRYLGVKYIIVDGKDPIFPELTKKILKSMLKTVNRTNQITLLENYTHRYLFRIENYTPVHALTYIPKNREQIPWNTEKINKIQIIQKTDILEIHIQIPQDYWIIIPIKHDKNLKIALDNQPAQVETAYPRIIAIKTPKGNHIIQIQITTTTNSKLTLIITLTSWTTTVAYIIIQKLFSIIKRKKHLNFNKN